MEPSLEDLARERHARCNPGFPWRLIGLIALCLAVGGLGSAATMPEIKGWYAGLIKPPFNPPNWIFGPVWSTLYVLMAASAAAARSRSSRTIRSTTTAPGCFRRITTGGSATTSRRCWAGSYRSMSIWPPPTRTAF